ncbi:MAG: GAF domain-containing sensor histidine kinase [Anaerolineae bacterium]|nr:GAF domain-containing sensor histidine kinase [Anaerolineae bacterium]
MQGRTNLPHLIANRSFVDNVVNLLSRREPVGLASEALSILIRDLGAAGGSLFYAARPPVRVRRGDLPAAIVAHVDQWEANVERRITSGPWVLAKGEEILSACIPVKGTGQAILYSLLSDEQEVTGAASLAFTEGQVPTGEHRELLRSFLRAIGGLMSVAGDLILTKARLSQLTLFYQVAQSMASTFDLGKVLDDTMQLASAVLDASASALMLIDEESGELVSEYAHGQLGELLRKQHTPLQEGIAGWVATHGVPVVVNDVNSDPRFNPLVDAQTGFPTRSVVCVPLKIRNKTIGVLEVLNKRSEQGFDSEDLGLVITTANQAAVAIENARLYQSLREERDRIIQVQEDVRRQVARNLHDGTVQFLSAITMGIDHMERLLEFKPEAARSELEALRDLTRQATQQARLALFELRPLILETKGLVPALEAYVQQLEESEGFQVHLEAPVSLPELDASVARTVFVIVQEAVTNAKKHASPKDVWLRLSGEKGWLQVMVEDNGKGFDVERVNREYDRRGSIGMLSMRERAELIDGTLEIRSKIEKPETGTQVILRVPLPGTADEAMAIG